MRHDKADGLSIEIPATFTSSTGAMADPGTSFKIYIYPAGSETATIDGADLDKVGSVVGQYSYTWDITNVSAGNYYGHIIAVDSAVNYGTSISIDIADTRTSVSNVSEILTDTGTTLPALITSSASGSGTAKTLKFTETESGSPLSGMLVWATTDSAGNNLYTSKQNRTDSGGQITLYFVTGTYYIWTEKSATYAQSITI